jgi:hypothetical protein
MLSMKRIEMRRIMEIDQLNDGHCFPILRAINGGERLYVREISFETRLADDTIRRSLEICLRYHLAKRYQGNDSKNRLTDVYEITPIGKGLLEIVDEGRQKAQDYIERKCICDEKPGK